MDNEQQAAGDAGAAKEAISMSGLSESNGGSYDGGAVAQGPSQGNQENRGGVIEFPTSVIKRLGHLETAVSRLQQAVAELTGTKLA